MVRPPATGAEPVATISRASIVTWRVAEGGLQEVGRGVTTVQDIQGCEALPAGIEVLLPGDGSDGGPVLWEEQAALAEEVHATPEKTDHEPEASQGEAVGGEGLPDAATPDARVAEASPRRTMPGRRGWLRTLVLACSDTACFVAATALAAPFSSVTSVSGPGLRILAALTLGAGAWVLVFHLMGLYRPSRFSPGEEVRRILAAAGVGTTLVLLAGLLPGDSLSPGALGRAWLAAVGLEIAARWGIGCVGCHFGKSRGRPVRTLVVGARQEVACLADRLRSADPRFDLLGYVELPTGNGFPDGRLGGEGAGSNGFPRSCDTEDLRAAIHQNAVECVVISPAVPAEQALPILRAGRQAGADLRVFTALPAILTSRVKVEQVGGYATLCLGPATLSGPKAAVKRVVDVVISTLTLILLLPLMSAVAAAIKLCSPGPVIYRQARVTKGGRVFTMYKFRTMATDDAGQSSSVSIDPALPYFKMREDPRVFRLGRLLRSLSIDELPQLINVIRGDMSLVGPRPLWTLQVGNDLDALSTRHDVRAGITGWWQVNGRSDVPAEEAFRLDAAYVESWSLSLDLYILLRTVGAVVSRRGAY
jgi:exopolysaccharide biosynthesis polyprenyl glycosylphosphotransferase